jgi:hypothetical protein
MLEKGDVNSAKKDLKIAIEKKFFKYYSSLKGRL